MEGRKRWRVGRTRPGGGKAEGREKRNRGGKTETHSCPFSRSTTFAIVLANPSYSIRLARSCFALASFSSSVESFCLVSVEDCSATASGDREQVWLSGKVGWREGLTECGSFGTVLVDFEAGYNLDLVGFLEVLSELIEADEERRVGGLPASTSRSVRRRLEECEGKKTNSSSPVAS